MIIVPLCLESKAKVILELGLGHNENVLKPSCVKVLKPDKVLAVACGKTHTVVGMISGRVFESDRFICRSKLYGAAVIRYLRPEFKLPAKIEMAFSQILAIRS